MKWRAYLEHWDEMEQSWSTRMKYGALLEHWDEMWSRNAALG